MKLIHKFVLWYFTLTLIVFGAGAMLFVISIKREIDVEATRRLKSEASKIAEQLAAKQDVQYLPGYEIEIKEMDFSAPLVEEIVFDKSAQFSAPLPGPDRKLGVSRSVKVEGKHYLITVLNFVAEPDEILYGTLWSLFSIFILLIVGAGIIGGIVSKKILSPFYQILESIRSFQLSNGSEKIVKVEKYTTHEFAILFEFLEQMTTKVQNDYLSLKSFTENASHEFQTPIAVIQGKLELLMNTGIDKEQSKLILDINNEVQRLISLSNSLMILTKVENHQFNTISAVEVGRHIYDIINKYAEMIDCLYLNIDFELREEVKVHVNEALLSILISNLMKNAIIHNNDGGSINILLTKQHLVIQNTGQDPGVPPSELFERFKKGKTDKGYAGLGLSIVKEICKRYSWEISYEYKNSRHVIEIVFQPKLV